MSAADNAPYSKPIRIFLVIEISGDARRASKYAELLEMETRTTVDFMNAMFRSAEPSFPCPTVNVHPRQVE